MKRGYTQADADAHGEMLANRVAKTLRKLKPLFDKRKIEAFRVYDWDIPEVRAIVDWYAGHIVIAEYTRTQTETVEDWLGTVAAALARKLKLPDGHLHVRRRHTGEGTRYEKLSEGGVRLAVREGDLQFWVNLDTYLDTGLFADHRLTRMRVRDEAHGRRFLNLFCYTGSFTCYAAAGGASATTSVDASNTYLEWAQANLQLNGLGADKHRLAKDDVTEHLYYERNRGEWYDLCVVDPPSFSIGRGRDSFDVQRDHPKLLDSVLGLMRPGGVVYFSTNHQRFEPHLDQLAGRNTWTDITADTIDLDYRNKQVHRCFRIAL